MDRYKMLEKLGEGASGTVWKALRDDNELVAIKVMSRFLHYSDAVCEAKSINLIGGDLHVVRLLEVFIFEGICHLVLEYMETDLHKLINSRSDPFPEQEIRMLCFQILKGLAFLHNKGCCHRDIKPGNILMTNHVVKIADFGLAINMIEREKTKKPLEGYVCTRWYRAPELLMRSPTYDYAVDIWSVGVLMAEFFMLGPLFKGKHEPDQLYLISSVFGSPTTRTWGHGLKLAAQRNYSFPPEFNGVDVARNLRLIMPSASHEAIDLVRRMCYWNPHRRPTAQRALKHPFFRECFVGNNSLDKALTLMKKLGSTYNLKHFAGYPSLPPLPPLYGIEGDSQAAAHNSKRGKPYVGLLNGCNHANPAWGRRYSKQPSGVSYGDPASGYSVQSCRQTSKGSHVNTKYGDNVLNVRQANKGIHGNPACGDNVSYARRPNGGSQPIPACVDNVPYARRLNGGSYANAKCGDNVPWEPPVVENHGFRPSSKYGGARKHCYPGSFPPDRGHAQNPERPDRVYVRYTNVDDGPLS